MTLTTQEQAFVERDSRRWTLTELVRTTHRLGLYDDCDECRRTGGHE